MRWDPPPLDGWRGWPSKTRPFLLGLPHGEFDRSWSNGTNVSARKWAPRVQRSTFQGHSRSLELTCIHQVPGTYDFLSLLTFYRNHGPILYRFQDVGWKNVHFPTARQRVFNALLPWNFATYWALVPTKKTRKTGLPGRQKVCWFRYNTWTQQTCRQMDGNRPAVSCALHSTVRSKLLSSFFSATMIITFTKELRFGLHNV